MKMKAVIVLGFLLFVSYVACGSAQNSSQFSYFWAVHSWPPGYCLEKDCTIFSSIFVLHGLWPVDQYGQTMKGTNESSKNIRGSVNTNKTLRQEMDTYWPSLTTKNRAFRSNFWDHEWRQHGTAQKLHEELDYFRRAIELVKMTNLRETLERGGVVANGSTYRKDEYKKAIKSRTRNVPVLDCVFRNGDYILKEVIICVDAQARNFIACNNYTINRESCRQNIRFPAPVT